MDEKTLAGMFPPEPSSTPMGEVFTPGGPDDKMTASKRGDSKIKFPQNIPLFRGPHVCGNETFVKSFMSEFAKNPKNGELGPLFNNKYLLHTGVVDLATARVCLLAFVHSMIDKDQNFDMTNLQMPYLEFSHTKACNIWNDKSEELEKGGRRAQQQKDQH